MTIQIYGKKKLIYLLGKYTVVSYINLLGFSRFMSLKGLTERKIHFFDQQNVRLYNSIIFEPQVYIGNDKSKRSKQR